MPFVGDVFGLSSVYEKQVTNVESRNFASWPESVTYGYFGGGANPPFPTRTNILSRLDFSNETLSNPGKNLPSAIDNNAAVTSSFYGYYGGGRTAPTTFINTVSRLDFSNETISLPGKNLPVATSDMGGVSGSSYGYFGGGSTPTIASTVSRLDFSSETLSLPGKNLPVATTLLTATSSTSYGYFGAGFPSYVCTISRLDFSTENVSLPGKDLPYGRYTLAATSSNYYGYFGGGQITTTTYSSVISRLDFSTEGTSSFPTQGALQDAAVGNSSYGYFGGGEVNTIRRFDFSSETIGLPGNNFPLSVSSQGALSGGSSIYRGSKTYGYIAGGFSPPSINTISRLDFSSETTSNPGKNLPNARYSISAVSNNFYGYFGGGYIVPLSSRICTITRLDFSNETINDPGKNLPTVLSDSGGLSNNSYGYFGGGYRFSFPLSVPALRICTISRLDFSTENINVISGQLPGTGKSEIGTVSNNFYGYFGGGFISVQNTDSIVRRLDFSNETVSAPGKNLPTPICGSGAFSNNSYGYFGGGYTAPSPNVATCTIRRLDFSNETISLPGKNIPYDKMGMGSYSSSFNGYFSCGRGGFFSPIPNGAYSDNLKLDFSSETITSLPSSFSSARQAIAAVTNSN